MWLPFRKRLPPPSSHPGDPKPHGEHRCFPIHFTGPPFPNGPGSPYPRPTGHTGGVQKGKIRHELAVYLPLSSRIEQHGVILCLRRVIGVFSRGSVTSHWDVSGNNSFIIGEGSYDYRLLYYTVSQRDSESNDGMTTALFSLLVQDDVSGLIVLVSLHKVILIIKYNIR